MKIKAILWGILVEWWYSRLFGNSKIGKKILKEYNQVMKAKNSYRILLIFHIQTWEIIPTFENQYEHFGSWGFMRKIEINFLFLTVRWLHNNSTE